MRPLRWNGGGGLQARPDRTAEDQKPEQGPDRDRWSLAPSTLAPSGFLTDKGRDHRRRERRPIRWSRAKAGCQEASSEAEIALLDPHSEAHNLIEIRGILGQPEIDRRGRERGGPEWHHALMLKEPHEMVKPF